MSNRQPMTVFLATGGTGGHVFPALAVAERLGEFGLRPVLMTDGRGARIIRAATAATAATATVATGTGFPTRRIMAASPYGETFIKRLSGLTRLGIGLIQTILWTLWHRPRAVIGFGGYPSVAPVLLGRALRRPVMLHEQNAFFGRANAFLANMADVIALSWQSTANIPEGNSGKTRLTGIPVRAAFGAIGKAGYTPPQDEVTLLVVGGSLGAKVFGDTVPEAISRLPENLRRRLTIIHQVREEQIDTVRARYAEANTRAEVMAFINDMPRRMAAAHLVICRAGASSLAELAASGRPAILVPYPDAMDNHQHANAETVSAAGGGWCIPESEMSAGSLAGRITSLIENPESLGRAARAMLNLEHGDAATTIASHIAGMMERRTA